MFLCSVDRLEFGLMTGDDQFPPGRLKSLPMMISLVAFRMVIESWLAACSEMLT